MHGTRNVATSIHLRKWNQVAAELRFFEMLRDSFRVPRPWSSQRPRIQVVRYANEGLNPQFRLVMLWDALGSGVIHPTLMLENNQDSWLTVIRWRNERQPKILWDARPLLDSGGHHRPLLNDSFVTNSRRMSTQHFWFCFYFFGRCIFQRIKWLKWRWLSRQINISRRWVRAHPILDYFLISFLFISNLIFYFFFLEQSICGSGINRLMCDWLLELDAVPRRHLQLDCFDNWIGCERISSWSR